jgi:hypothetical protein
MAVADELRIELNQHFLQARMVKNVAFAVGPPSPLLGKWCSDYAIFFKSRISYDLLNRVQ